MELNRRTYQCFRTREGRDVLFGRRVTNNGMWQQAPWSESFVNILGDSHPRPKYQSRMKMLWDEEGLYVASKMEDPELYATQTQRNSFIWQFDPDFEVFLKPSRVAANYYEFEVNCRNTVFELTLSKPYAEGGVATHGTNLPSLRSEVHIDGDLENQPRGWELIVFFPFRDLFNLLEHDKTTSWPRASQVWQMNASRVHWRTVKDPVTSKSIRDPSYRNWGEHHAHRLSDNSAAVPNTLRSSLYRRRV
ncbi:hypothetical protein NDN08_003721 [Rhodosorus marinus]|uniref:Carbohydrate-binding domain-containing protein n=1 Tax=Rhodosorus marinus TaxID=101924 RepID=A0AAV8UYF1_9RHOD|nr:hypothetical protein NDN08_003721 [Rhodosorus marinus]